MKLPSDIVRILTQRFSTRHREWLVSTETIPALTISLGIPTEQAAMREIDAVRVWASAWRSWQGVGALAWTDRQWKVLGTQRLPDTLTLHGVDEVAQWIGQQDRWKRAQGRFGHLTACWPALAVPLSRLYGVLADYDDADFQRLQDMLSWVSQHPQSRLYPRQLPVAGMDSKWLEARRPVLAELIATIRGVPPGSLDFHELCGLRRPPAQIRMRALDPALRARLGGIGDLAAPVEQLAALQWRPRVVLIVENVQTGLAFDDMPGTVVFMGLGYGVDLLQQLPWIRQAHCIYWGDLDTHGFAILNRARTRIAHIESILMDELTLSQFQPFWSREPSQHRADELSSLSPDESSVYEGLRKNSWGQDVRLEQERIDWTIAMEKIRDRLDQ
ncbi:MAG: Wadjet anti-phage system protein JetD domain-containing protein [Pseudomonadota bacterium]